MNDSKENNNDDNNNNNKTKRLKGMRIRDEFICPITYELMREPTVAPDGHTYEKNVIEKWIRDGHNISPRSGQPMLAGPLYPNHNLKKLIQDLIDEGGEGFYTKDISNKDRLFDVRPEKLLVLECLGPPESDWNQQSFQVSNLGCIGGRKVSSEEDFQSREPMTFKDVTVSRKHFEIFPKNYADGKQEFYVRDLGSAGGTFIRIAFGIRKQLNPGMIILLGKHQFTVSSIDDGPNANRDNSFDVSQAKSNSSRVSNVKSDEILSTVKEINHIAEDLQSNSNTNASDNRQELSNRLRHLTLALSSQLDEKNTLGDVKDGERCASLMDYTGPSMATICAGSDSKDPGAMNVDNVHSASKNSRRCTITCCAPDGSPLQGQSYTVTTSGATIGRKATNTIPLIASMTDETTGEIKQVNVDTAISSEHARIEFDSSTGQFYIYDGGSVGKASTNGTWYRLSGPYQESPPHLLEGSMEVLIGTVRFIVRESMTIAEHGVPEGHK